VEGGDRNEGVGKGKKEKDNGEKVGRRDETVRHFYLYNGSTNQLTDSSACLVSSDPLRR
jgi:hypothetical protein